ncbi:hypothetical protein KI387_030431, partial [Taxus chinensis]
MMFFFPAYAYSAGNLKRNGNIRAREDAWNAVKMSLDGAHDLSVYIVELNKTERSASRALKECVGLLKDAESLLYRSVAGLYYSKINGAKEYLWGAGIAVAQCQDALVDAVLFLPDPKPWDPSNRLYDLVQPKAYRVTKLITDAVAAVDKISQPRKP